MRRTITGLIAAITSLTTGKLTTFRFSGCSIACRSADNLFVINLIEIRR